MSEEQKKIQDYQIWIILIGISLTTGANGWTNSVSQTLIEVFPNISSAVVRSAVTAGSLSALVVGLATGAFVGRKYSYRTSAIAGLLCLLVGGLIPAFYCKSFAVIWFCRFLTGCGAAVNRISQPLIRMTVGSEKQAKWFGLAQVVSSGTSIVMQNLAGVLARQQWNYIYLVNLVLLIPLALVVFKLKEPEHMEQSFAAKGEKQSFKLEKRVIPYLLLAMWSTLTLYPVYTSASTIIKARGLGDISVAASIGSLYTLGVLAMNLFLIGRIIKHLRRWSFTVGLLMACSGLGLILIAPNVFTVGLGTFIAGASYAPMIISINTFTSDASDPGFRTFNMTTVMAGTSIAGFASSFWTSFASRTFSGMLPFLQSDVEVVSFINICVCLALVVLTIFWNPSVAVRKD